MDVSFGSARLQRLCESEKELRRAHGEKCAKKVKTRLADLRAASTLADLRRLPGRCHELDGARRGQLAVELTGRRRLIFAPAGSPSIQKEDGGLDWKLVEAVQVIEIVDYHRG